VDFIAKVIALTLVSLIGLSLALILLAVVVQVWSLVL